MNFWTAVWMFWVLGAGAPTVTVTGVGPVRPLRLRDTPAMVWVAPGVALLGLAIETPLIVFEVEVCVAPPLIEYEALVPATAYWDCSERALSESPVIAT